MRDNWETVKLEELGKSFGGLTNKSKDDFGKGTPFIPYLNIFENAKIDPNFLDFVKVKPTEKQNKVQYGDLFFTTSSETPHEVGMTSVLLTELGEAYLNSFCFGFRLKNFKVLLPEYATYLFRSKNIRKKISDLAQGSTRYNLSKNILFNKTYLDLPPLPQQRKIANILTTCDTVIEKTEAAIAKYHAIKQGMMHDLFTRGIVTETTTYTNKNGKVVELRPNQLRPKYEEAPELYKESELGWIPKEWEVKRLEEFLQLKSGESITSKSISKVEDYPVYGGNGLRGYTNTYTHEGAYVLIGRQGALCGNITFAIGKFFASEHAVVVSIKDDSHVKWVKHKLISMELNKYSEASAQPGLSVNKIVKLQIAVPPGIEQKEIASRLTSLETKIHTEQSTLSKYWEIKAGLMQDLLSGKVEV